MTFWQPPWDDEVRRYAVVALLALPDPPGLPRRGYRYISGGDKARQPSLKVELEVAHYRSLIASRRDISGIVSVRRYPVQEGDRAVR